MGSYPRYKDVRFVRLGAVILCLLTALFSQPTFAATTTVVAQHSGKCLDVIGGNSGTGNGVLLEQWTCVAGANNQAFTLQDMGGGQYEIIASHSGKCVGVVNGSTANGANIEQRDCAGLPQQLWNAVSMGTGTYRLVSVPSGRCLDVTAALAQPLTVCWSSSGIAWPARPIKFGR